MLTLSQVSAVSLIKSPQRLVDIPKRSAGTCCNAFGFLSPG